jgi:integrase
MAQVDLRYLWFATGRHGRRYPFYRREGLLIPLTSLDGRRLKEGDIGIAEAYERIHASFGIERRPMPFIGTLADVIGKYRADVEYQKLKPKSKKEYDRWLNWLNEKHGRRKLVDFPREAVLLMRKEHMATPSAANTLLKVLGILLNYAEDHPLALRLPTGWQNPARRVKRLKEGEGHTPWEEDEIESFQRTWHPEHPLRVIFETFLNTGQRGIDVIAMRRSHYRRGEIKVVQIKTGQRVWIPVADDLRAVLDPWLASHNEEMFFPNGRSASISPNYMRENMRDAIGLADLPDTCTLHGLRYTFATRSIELGMDYQTIESIVGHKTMAMAIKYTEQRRRSRLAIQRWNAGLKWHRDNRVANERGQPNRANPD